MLKSFLQVKNTDYIPIILDQRTADGDIQIQFSNIKTRNTGIETIIDPKALEDKKNGRITHREYIATIIIKYLKKNSTPDFTNRTCIDIGCRSGENSVAMMRAGANVTAIDPDDREFSKAIENGLSPTQLYKKTLQEFQQENPTKKFDFATVFLWNIPFEQYESFTKSLRKTITPNGTILISFRDSCYLNDPIVRIDKLMKKYFHIVPHPTKCCQIAHYILICKKTIRDEES